MVKLEHSSMETIQMIQKATAMGNRWLAVSSRQCTCSGFIVSCSFLGKHQITQVTQPLYSPDLMHYDFWLSPKLKSPLKGKRFQTVNEIQENWENCVRSQAAYIEGDWGVIVLCTVFLVSCIFFSKCLFFILHGWIPSGLTIYIYIYLFKIIFLN